jgi:hypothetical protein
MSDYLSTTARPPPIKKCRRGAQRRKFQTLLESVSSRIPTRESIEPTANRMHSPISILNDDVLLNIFYLFRLDVVPVYEESEPSNVVNDWLCLRWWYKPAHVSRRWRRIILSSPSLLDLHLLCTNLNKVHVADMLAHSPPLPLAVFYSDTTFNITAEDEEHALLAISHHDRVHSIVLWMPAANLQRLIPAMGSVFPNLEYLSINCRWQADVISFTLPQTFQAPSLHHIYLGRIALPKRSPILTSNGGLVSLWLFDIPASAYFPPNYMLTQLSHMPQLEKLGIEFSFPVPNRDVENTAITTDVSLPNLGSFSFKGVSTYLEGLLARIMTPVLSMFEVELFNQLTFTVPRLLQFIRSSDFESTRLYLAFDPNFFILRTDGHQGLWGRSLDLRIRCRHLDWQVASAAQLFHSLSPVLSVVEKLTLSHWKHSQSSEWHNDVDRIQWRKLLEPFSNVKVLHVEVNVEGNHATCKGLFCSLRSEEGESSMELLPNLQELSYFGDQVVRDEFTPFIKERQAAGHPVHLSWSWSISRSASSSHV